VGEHEPLPTGVDPTIPNVARMYDYALGAFLVQPATGLVLGGSGFER